jgi:hypothetical protein
MPDEMKGKIDSIVIEKDSNPILLFYKEKMIPDNTKKEQKTNFKNKLLS